MLIEKKNIFCVIIDDIRVYLILQKERQQNKHEYKIIKLVMLSQEMF